MKRMTLIVGTAVIAAIIAAVFFIMAPQGPRGTASTAFIDASDQALVARGKEIYVAQCAACHGAKLEGQPNWRERLPSGRLPAPPHDETGHTWHHPDAVLFDIVKHGLVPGKTAPEGYESDMPAYAGVLSDADIVAVLAYIKSTWPREVREMQESVGRH